MKLIDISTPKFHNTFTMVDDADYEYLNQWKWCMCDKGYAQKKGQRIAGKSKQIYMHLEIMKPSPGMLVDHRFGNKLDNRRENLRICTKAENQRNRKPTSGRTLPKGVDWRTKSRRFAAQISANNRQIHLGYFDTASEAEAAYIEAAKKYHGEFYRDPSSLESPALASISNVKGGQA